MIRKLKEQNKPKKLSIIYRLYKKKLNLLFYSFLSILTPQKNVCIGQAMFLNTFPHSLQPFWLYLKNENKFEVHL